MAIERTIDIAKQVCEALTKAHKAGIVHRDIKPANIMLTSEGEVKILDFGLAKLSGQTKLTKSGTTLGTVAYMSPEQTSGGQVDHRTDIWSLGVILYEMLAGENPFKGDYEQAIVYSIINEEPEFITKVRGEVPAQIESILEKALAKSPEKRFETMEAMLVDLQESSKEIKAGLRGKSPLVKLGRKQRKTVLRVLAVSLIVMITAGIYLWRTQFEEARQVPIMLMPLNSFTDDTEQEWFSDGMTDALITALAKISGFRVMALSTTMRYKGTSKSPPEIAAELGLKYLVEGLVAMTGNRVKVSARLVDAVKEEYLWADDYEGEVKNILGLQGEIASAIAGKVKVRLKPQDKDRLAGTRQVNPDTYKAYLRGTFLLNQLTDESVQSGLAMLQEAVDKDPDEPLAWAALALGYSLISSHSDDPPPDADEQAKEAVRKALELDDTLAEVQMGLAETKMYGDWDWAGAEQAYKRAIESNPSLARAHAHYAWQLLIFERQDEVIKHAKLAHQLDPVTPTYSAWLADLYYWQAKNYDKAIEEAKKTLELNPIDGWPYFTLGNCYAAKGRYEEAIEMHNKASADNNRWKWALGRTYAMAGRTDEALQMAAEIQADGGSSLPWNLAAIYAALGENEKALDWLEAAYEGHSSWTPWIKGVFFEMLYEEPRFKALLKKLDLPAGD
jgi:TolB-like protein/Tfp pilus assembly protein PilF